MRIPILLLILFVVVPSHADGPKKWMRGHCPEPGGPWLGIKTTWLEKATAAQLNEVPAGFGLLIESVEPVSPAFEAGLQSMDVIWKFDNQFVANKGQLFALLKLKGVGNEGTLTVSRAGENLVLPVTVGVRPENGRELAEAAAEVLMPPLPGVIVRQVDLGKRSGFISEDGVTVSLSRKIGGFDFHVLKDGDVVNHGTLAGEDSDSWPETIDDKTRRKLHALFQSLMNAEQREEDEPRVPRVRRVPVPQDSSKK
ncbi:MAG: PDZ domain-containing protein [Roseibacillus sp.]